MDPDIRCVPEVGVTLRDRYEPTDIFALVPQLGLRFEPQLAQLDRLLDDDDDIVARVRADLARRPARGVPIAPHTDRGVAAAWRPSAAIRR